MKIGKIIVEPNTGRLEFEQIELPPDELPNIKKLIVALTELQVATMNASKPIPPPAPVRSVKKDE